VAAAAAAVADARLLVSAARSVASPPSEVTLRTALPDSFVAAAELPESLGTALDPSGASGSAPSVAATRREVAVAVREVPSVPRPAPPSGFPSSYEFEHNLLAAHGRALLAVPPEERGPTAAVRSWDHVEILEALEASDVLGGWPLEHDGVELDGVHDDGHVPRLDPDQWVAAHQLYGAELAEGWLDIYGDGSVGAVPWDGYRVSHWRLTEKSHLGHQLSKRGLVVRNGRLVEGEQLKWRLVFNGSSGRWGKGGERVSRSFNDRAPYADRKRWPMELDGVHAAGAAVVEIDELFGGVECVKVDEDAGFKRMGALGADSRRHFGLRILDPRRPVPQHVLDGEQPRPEDLVLAFCSRLPFGTVQSVALYGGCSRLINALFLWEGNPYLSTKIPGEALRCCKYVDDALVVAAPGWAAKAKERLFELLRLYGLRPSLKKDAEEGAVVSSAAHWPEGSCRIYLGVEVDVQRKEMRVPADRVEETLRRLDAAVQAKAVLRRDFESIVGVLNHAADCIPYARLFLRRSWALLAATHGRWVRLSRSIVTDLQFWRRLLRESNGKSLMYDDLERLAEDCGLYTDASLSGFCGVLLRDDGETVEYFAGQWSDYGIDTSGLHISVLELLTVLLAAAQWGSMLHGRCSARVDNSSCCDVLNGSRCRDPGMSVCMRELYHIQACESFLLRARWIPTAENVMADAGSRDDWVRFREHARDVLGRDTLVRVEPRLDVGVMLKRIVRAQSAYDAQAERRREACAARVARHRRRAPLRSAPPGQPLVAVSSTIGPSSSCAVTAPPSPRALGRVWL